MSTWIILGIACVLVQGVAAAGFDLSSIQQWYQQHHTGNTAAHTLSSGCDNTDGRDHVIRLLTDWYYHHETDAFRKFYAEVALIDIGDNAGSIPHPSDRRTYTSYHDEAYMNHNTVPDIAHLESLVGTSQMNAECRSDILDLINSYEHISEHTTTTVKPTPHQHVHHHTHAPTHAPVVTSPNPIAAQQGICDQLKIVADLVNTSKITHHLAGMCSDGSRSQSEAFVLQACSAPAPVQWRQGEQVTRHCAHIPKYSPISTFLFGSYASDGTSLSGILLDCLPNGFKMASQVCGHSPGIYSLFEDGSTPKQNAGSYYRIMW